MLSVLADRTYRRLFAAQIIALVGTGMMAVALRLLALEIAGDQAGGRIASRPVGHCRPHLIQRIMGTTSPPKLRRSEADNGNHAAKVSASGTPCKRSVWKAYDTHSSYRDRPPSTLSSRPD